MRGIVESLGFRTDLMLLQLQGSSIERRVGYRVIRTPRNPTFHWGNFVLLDAPPAAGTVEGWIELFRREFPDAPHLALGVDGTEGAAGDSEELAALGLEVERITMLTATALRAPAQPLPAAELRMLEPGDWDAAVTLERETYPSEEASFGEFLRAQFLARRQLQENGHGGWFGAFIDGRMVSGLGLYDDGAGVARYQSVVTHPDFRGRGLAGALVGLAGRLALSTRSVDTLVIAADPNDAAIRLYRALGFSGSEMQVQLSRTAASSN